MSREKLDQLLNNTVRDGLIENLERRQREIIEDIENTLRPYREVERDEAGDDFESEADTLPDNNDVQLNWDYEEAEDWDDE